MSAIRTDLERVPYSLVKQLSIGGATPCNGHYVRNMTLKEIFCRRCHFKFRLIRIILERRIKKKKRVMNVNSESHSAITGKQLIFKTAGKIKAKLLER